MIRIISGKRLMLFCVLIAAAAITLLGYYYYGFHSKPHSIQMKASINNVSPVPKNNYISVEGRYLLNGTITWARAVEKDARNKDGSYNYDQPFSQLDSFNRSAYDAWSTDFECPITNNIVPYQTQVDNLIFNCRPEFLPFAAKYFNLYDLANNHTDNQGGQIGLTETRQHLDKTPGVQYFGSFDPSVLKDICEVISLPIRIQKSDNTELNSALPVAFCAWHYFYRKPLPSEIETMQRYAKIMPVFAFVEMGVEYHSTADSTQVDIAHKIIDQGPEFLIANNPHWVQNTEVYKNKLIVYSTGNFIFDQIDKETKRSASIDVKATLKYDDNIAKWIALAPSCTSFHDTCLEQAESQGLTKPTIHLSFAVVAGEGGAGKITHKADALTQTEVEQRLNWADSMNKLNQP